MIRNLFFVERVRKLKYIGLEGLTDDLQRSRVMLLNGLLQVAFVVSVVAGIISGLLGAWIPVLVNLLCIILLIFPAFYLQKKKQYDFAGLYFIIGALGAVVYISLYAIAEGGVVDTENILFGLAVAAILLFERFRLYAVFGLLAFSLLSLKLVGNYYLGDNQMRSAILLMLNNGIALIGLFAFTSVFRGILYRLLSRLEVSSKRLREQKKRLAEQERIMRVMIDNVPAFLAMFRKDGRYSVVNKSYAEAFQIDIAKASELSFYDVLSDKILEKHLPLIKRVMSGEDITFEDTIRFPDGKTVIGRGRYIPVFNAHDEVYLASAFFIDISDLKEKEQRLAELNHTKDKLFSIIAHDIRAPIGSLQSLLDLWEQGMIEADEFEEMAGYLKQSVSELSFMLENLLHWARGQLDGFNTQQTSVALTEMMTENLDLFRPLAAEKSIQIQYTGPEQARVCADANQCRLILRNLLSNAIKFSREGGIIILRIEERGDSWQCSVEDEGQGMSEEQIQQILKQEVSSSKGTAGEVGTGLGLVLIQEMIANNGGEFGIKSKLGMGSCFWLRLLKADVAAACE